MSLDGLMQLLQNNSVQLEQQRMGNQTDLMASIASRGQIGSSARHPRGHPSSGHGGNNGFHAKGPDPLLRLRAPVRGITVTSNYGPRINPITHRQSDHTGVDFGASLGTPVRAAQSGFVKQANPNTEIYGNQIVLGHGHGYQTMYGHLNNYIVKPGQRVKRGQIIGYVGSTGWSTGPHLHFETWYHGNPMNPMKFLS